MIYYWWFYGICYGISIIYCLLITKVENERINGIIIQTMKFYFLLSKYPTYQSLCNAIGTLISVQTTVANLSLKAIEALSNATTGIVAIIHTFGAA